VSSLAKNNLTLFYLLSEVFRLQEEYLLSGYNFVEEKAGK